MDTNVEEIMKKAHCSGVVVAEANGLPLVAKGTLDKESAPLVTELISLAKQLEPHNKETPVVTVQAEQHKTMATMKSIDLTLEFSGGSEFLVDGKKLHEVKIEFDDSKPYTIRRLVDYIRQILLKDCDRPELLIDNGTVRPGVLVLVNESDWELFEGIDTELSNGDKVTFISTLHGG
ncbi:hypothetical protein WR25_18717 [Diploscapter pachys]|uniref:Ubiquitin-related modifier 1 homolog n=1 Tax=Diploscapter pachys TaxID=2018661 RepID=A0A2A2KFI0_9BILA|nr:hypothetical protein WR25_18717 [Diploscapter pachys]